MESEYSRDLESMTTNKNTYANASQYTNMPVEIVDRVGCSEYESLPGSTKFSVTDSSSSHYSQFTVGQSSSTNASSRVDKNYSDLHLKAAASEAGELPTNPAATDAVGHFHYADLNVREAANGNYVDVDKQLRVARTKARQYDEAPEI